MARAESADRCLEYHLDERDRIAYIGPGWDDFASENAAEELSRTAVLHQNLWDFITDAETSLLYRMILQRTAEQGRPVVFHYRCDSPRKRRYMQMSVSRRAPGARFLSRTLRTEARPAVGLLTPAGARSDELLPVCSWCNAIRCGTELWLEVEEAILRLGLFGEPRLPRLTHGICPPCRDRMITDIRRS